MEMMISSRHLEVSEPLRLAAHEKVTRLSRHLDGWDEAEIHFFEERNPRIADKEVCEITLRGHGHVVRAKAASPDPFTSVDRVVDKLAHQIEKLKTRSARRAHNGDSLRYPRGVALAGSLSGNGSGSPGDRDQGDHHDRGDEGDEGDEDPDSGRIVKVKRFDLKPMTPDEAALQLDLLGHTFYFFTNADTGAASVIYRRADGDLGLIDAT